MRFSIVLLFTLQIHALSMWDDFHPEAVTGITCKVQIVSMYTREGTVPVDVWGAYAHATRTGMPNWAFTLAEYGATDGGFRKAMKECEEWTLEANKRITAAKKSIDRDEKKK